MLEPPEVLNLGLNLMQSKYLVDLEKAAVAELVSLETKAHHWSLDAGKNKGVSRKPLKSRMPLGVAGSNPARSFVDKPIKEG